MKKIIWIIDDNEIDQLITCKLLESYMTNITVHSYSNATATIKDLQKGKSSPSLILLDLDMPIMDGWDFLTEFRKITISIPLYIHTHSINQNDKLQIEENHLVKGYLTKPLLGENIFTLTTEK